MSISVKQEALCTEFQTFFRLCGHVEYTRYDTEFCMAGRRDKVGKEDITVEELDLLHPGCRWNLPLKYKPMYVVGNCFVCLNKIENTVGGSTLPSEPARSRILGETRGRFGPTSRIEVEDKSEKYTPAAIRALAYAWRFKVEEDERVSPYIKRRQRTELQMRRILREAEWENDYKTQKASTPSFHKILDLSESVADFFSRERKAEDLFEPCEFEFDEDCFCGFPLSGASPLDADDAEPYPVRLIGVCKHVAHYKCLLKQLTAAGDRRCPTCRKDTALFVMKSTFDDPVYRWFEQRDHYDALDAYPRNLIQVAGYIPFKKGYGDPYDFEIDTTGIGRPRRQDVNFFDPCCGEDRWGDKEGGAN